MKLYSPLAVRISLSIVLVIAIMGGVGTFFLTAHMAGDLEEQFRERGQTLALLVARLVNEGIAEENLDLINRASYILEMQGVEYISVHGEFWDLIETYPPRTKHPHGIESARAHFAAHPESLVFLEEDQVHGVYDFYARVSYQPFLDSPPVPAGFIEIDISSQALLLARAKMFRLHLWVAVLFSLVTIALLVFLLHGLIIRPVRRLSREVALFGQGVMPRSLPRAGDEIGDLARQFYEMAATIEARNRALAKQRRYLDTLLSSSGYGIVAANAELVIRYFNPKAEQLYRCPASEVIGKNVREIHQMRKVDPDRLERALKVVHEQGAYTYNVRQEDGEGRTQSLEASIFAIRDEQGRVDGFLLMVQDVTERLRFQEELERSNLELEQFAYVAPHDLQEPLRVITGFVQLLGQRQEAQLDAEGREYMDFIVDGAARMKTLINDLLVYSRVTTKADLPEMVDLNQVLAVACKDLRQLIEENQAAIVCEDPLPTIRADRGQMGQLFQNLLGNAIRYRRPETAPRITLAARRQGRDWLISVTDNGIGIDPRYFARIFKIFQRLHTPEEYPGTGIGLAICKKIVERHQGRLWVESEPGKGACFLFTLPGA